MVRLYWIGNRIALESVLGKMNKKYNVEKITIRADAQTPHQAVVSVMDAAGKIGINKVFVATSSEKIDSQK